MCMSDKLSVLVLNPFSNKAMDEGINFGWLKKYSLDIHWWIKHFLRELWVWKILKTDEEILKDLVKWWDKSKLLKLIKSYCNKNNAVHFVFPLHYFELYFTLLENWSLKNKLILHLVYEDYQQDFNKIEEIEKLLLKNNLIIIWSLSHELSVLSENSDWRELQKFYDEIWFFQIQTSFSASEFLKKCNEEGKTIIDPVSFLDSQAMEDWDICLVWELDQEKLAGICKVFEVSKRENKKTEFNNFNPIFITKNLPNLEIFAVKSPYALYENHVLIEKEDLSTLPKIFSNNEVRMIQLWDKKHLKLLNKYFNNEKWVVFDWHKKIRCEDKDNEDWNLAVSSNELLLKRFSDEISNFEISFLSFEDSGCYVKEYLGIIEQYWLDTIIIDVAGNLLYSTLDFSKKNLNSEILNKLICKEFGL